jgi:hypothetical protein
MDLNPLSAILSIGEAAVQRIWPDPVKQAEEQRKLAQLAQEGDLARLQAHVQLLVGQLEINKQEAQHKSLFVAGWRPGVGWVATICLALAFIPKTIVLTAMWTWQCYLLLSANVPDIAVVDLPEFPDLGVTDLLGILGSMLGIGAMRSFDKAKGTQTDKIK